MYDKFDFHERNKQKYRLFASSWEKRIRITIKFDFLEQQPKYSLLPRGFKYNIYTNNIQRVFIKSYNLAWGIVCFRWLAGSRKTLYIG